VEGGVYRLWVWQGLFWQERSSGGKGEDVQCQPDDDISIFVHDFDVG